MLRLSRIGGADDRLIKTVRATEHENVTDNIDFKFTDCLNRNRNKYSDEEKQ